MYVCMCVCMYVCMYVCMHIHKTPVYCAPIHYGEQTMHLYTFIQTEKCSLCYDLTHSTPGFAANPNNCQKFYMCEPSNGPEKWTIFPMICPNCTFWDQDKLTCVEVLDDPDNTGICGHFTAVTPPLTLPTVSKYCSVHANDKMFSPCLLLELR